MNGSWLEGWLGQAVDLRTLAIGAVVGLVVGVLAGVLLAIWRGRQQLAALRETAVAEREARIAADTATDLARDDAETVRAERRAEVTALRDAAVAERDLRAAADTAAAVARQEVAAMRQALQDWEATRTEFLKTTHAGVLATAQQISSKLLEDHKRETEAAKEAAARQVKETTETLREQVQLVTDGVAQLKGQVAEKAVVLDTVWRALTSPSGAGHFAEVGLANTLRSFGLAAERDFVLQATIHDDNQRKRPDAIVFLPGDAALVIDSKASKFVIELAEAEGTEREEESYRSLARTMNQHLRDLTDRDYRGAVQAGYRRSGRENGFTRLLTVMYLPNEAALEKLGRADPHFVRKAAQAQIIPVGPAGLASIIGFASVEISLMRQIENQERIVVASERLLDSLAVAVGSAAAVGKGLKGAADAFAKFSSSLNARVLPRARTLAGLGLRPAKSLPANLPSYQVLDLGTELIEGEVTDIEEPSLVPPG